jgi:hypothetical protein
MCPQVYHMKCPQVYYLQSRPHDSDSKCQLTRQLDRMLHQEAGLDKAARVDGKFSDSPVGSSWLRTAAGMVAFQPSDRTPMIFVRADGAVYTAHQWLIHAAALARSVDPRCGRACANLGRSITAQKKA